MSRSNRYASVAATLALLFSLAGTATATSITLLTGDQVKDGSLSGVDLANHSVGAKKLKKHSLTARYLGVGSVTSSKVRNHTLTLRDLSSRTIAGLKGQRGPAGPQGAPGAAGAPGPAGTSIKLAGYVKTSPQTLPGDSVFHSAWSMNFSSTADQLFIVTGNIGNPTAGCQIDQQITVDGTPAPSVFNGGFLTFPVGAHTLSYELRASCPIDVPDQEVILIPFSRPS
jgi:hypothetical protein